MKWTFNIFLITTVAMLSGCGPFYYPKPARIFIPPGCDHPYEKFVPGHWTKTLWVPGYWVPLDYE